MKYDDFDIAYQIADTAFKDKVDKGGEPYMKHLVRVSSAVKKYGNACEIIGLLHDLLEDCPEWNDKSLSTFFSDMVVNNIKVLTRNYSETYEQYIDHISNWDIATKIKIADLNDNMDITRLPSLRDTDFKRLAKYHKAYLKLNQQV